MPYIAAKTWKQINTSISTLEKKIKEMEAKPASVGTMGYESIETIGCTPDGDNAAILNNYMADHRGEFINLFIPPGEWKFKDQWDIVDVVANVKGAGQGNTTLSFPAGVNGLHLFTTKKPGNKWGSGVIERLSIGSYGKIPITEGTHDGAAWDKSGIQLWTRYSIRDVQISNFSHNGIQVWGHIASSANSSWFHLEHIEVDSCGGDGIWVVGPDANAGSGIHIDVRDCGGWGIHDQSFLGCQWWGVMTHANKKGPYRVTADAARATFVGCYAEMDQPPAFFQTRNSYLLGGIHESGVQGGCQFYDGKIGNEK